MDKAKKKIVIEDYEYTLTTRQYFTEFLDIVEEHSDMDMEYLYIEHNKEKWKIFYTTYMDEISYYGLRVEYDNGQIEYYVTSDNEEILKFYNESITGV